MQAILFSAGLGTRLKPLTDNLPKALVEVAGKPVLQWNIEKLQALGCSRIVVNVHHFADKIIEFLRANHNFGAEVVISDERNQLLDTGGGLLKAKTFFKPDEPILAHNVDVLSDMDLPSLAQFHLKNNALATLVVRNRETQRYLLFDAEMNLAGWQNRATGETRFVDRDSTTSLKPLAFSGIQIINPAIFPLITQTGKFPIVETYLQLARKNKIVGFEDSSAIWIDIGKPEQLAKARELFA